jgi:hypothetical protein
MNPARRVWKGERMSASRTARAATRRRSARKPAVAKRAARPATKPPAKSAAPQQVLYRLCKPGWAVIVEKVPTVMGTRIVCPFCPHSHLVPGPVRGFRKLRRAQWIKLRRVSE